MEGMKQHIKPLRYYVNGSDFAWGVYDRRRRTRPGRNALVRLWTFKQEAEGHAMSLNMQWQHASDLPEQPPFE